MNNARKTTSIDRRGQRERGTRNKEQGTRILLVVLLMCIIVTGCIERTLLIQSDPPGANVCIDGDACGTTPATVPFSAYGKREVYLQMPGHFSRKEVIDVNPPVYAWFPLDFVFDVCWPFTIRDEQTFKFTLQPSNLGDTKALETRAHEFTDRAKAMLEHERVKRGVSLPPTKAAEPASTSR